jgi:hypothetical protein
MYVMARLTAHTHNKQVTAPDETEHWQNMLHHKTINAGIMNMHSELVLVLLILICIVAL